MIKIIHSFLKAHYKTSLKDEPEISKKLLTDDLTYNDI